MKSFSENPPIPDVNVGQALWTLSGEVYFSILLIVILPNTTSFIIVNPAIDRSKATIIIAYHPVKGCWILLITDKRLRHHSNDGRRPKKRARRCSQLRKLHIIKKV